MHPGMSHSVLVPLTVFSGSHYIRETSLGGKAELIIKTSAKSLADANSKTSDLTASVSGGYGLFSASVSAGTQSSDSSSVVNSLKESKVQQNQSPVSTGASHQSHCDSSCLFLSPRLTRVPRSQLQTYLLVTRGLLIARVITNCLRMPSILLRSSTNWHRSHSCSYPRTVAFGTHRLTTPCYKARSKAATSQQLWKLLAWLSMSMPRVAQGGAAPPSATGVT